MAASARTGTCAQSSQTSSAPKRSRMRVSSVFIPWPPRCAETAQQPGRGQDQPGPRRRQRLGEIGPVGCGDSDIGQAARTDHRAAGLPDDAVHAVAVKRRRADDQQLAAAARAGQRRADQPDRPVRPSAIAGQRSRSRCGGRVPRPSWPGAARCLGSSQESVAYLFALLVTNRLEQCLWPRVNRPKEKPAILRARMPKLPASRRPGGAGIGRAARSVGGAGGRALARQPGRKILPAPVGRLPDRPRRRGP
jgi:hypothetical protein